MIYKIGRVMKKFLVRIICCLIPSEKRRLELRLKYIKGLKIENNRIVLVAPDGTRRNVRSVRGCEFMFSGSNNYIELHEPVRVKLKVHVSSNVNIKILPSLGGVLHIYKGRGESAHTNNVVIGKGFSSSGSVKFELAFGGCGDITIGEDCMFAYNINVRTGDYHTIFDKDTGRVLNYNRDVVIGNHVWVASDVFMGKGTKISDNSVVGAHSVVTRAFDESNVVVAGVPARVVKTGINWNRLCMSDYEKSLQ